MKSKLPHWDLSRIYKGVDSADFKNDLKRAEDIIAKLKERASSSSASLLSILRENDECRALCVNLSSYASALLSTDTSNATYLKAMAQCEDIGTSYSEAESVVISNVAKRSDEFSLPELEPYSFLLNEMRTIAEHQMSLEEESLAAELLKVSALSWSRLQESITSNISEGDKTLIELRGMANSPDRAIRENAFNREVKILKDNEVALAAALNGVKGTTLLLEKRRGWKDPIDRSIFTARISRRALDALISALEESRGMFQDYLKTKAKLLGIDCCDFFDLFAPVGKASRVYSFEEAKELVRNAYYGLSEKAGAFIDKAFNENWIDAEPHKGKVGGAYQTDFPVSGEPRVFTNFDGSYDSVATLAHELGHAYHSYILKDEVQSRREYPMTLAETASIFGENLLFQSVIKKSNRDEQLPLIEQYVMSACQVCIDILSRFYFEREAFRRRRDGELTPSEYCQIMVEAEEAAYGDAINIKHPYMWAVKSHYYSESFSFYNYPYAFGQLFALAIFSLKDSKGDFASYYDELLSLTGAMSAYDVARHAGVDIEDKDFWMSGINIIASYAERLKEWL